MNKLIINDNLIALKLLDSESIDCIYTDPPYLTGNTKLTYKDNKPEQEWIEFMRERLVECKRVMKKSATMLIHIDENMHVELATLCYEVFNKRNHITTFVWKKKSSSSAQSKFATVEHEYIIACAKDIKHCKWNGIPQFDPKDIITSHSILANESKNTGVPEHHQYPLYVQHGDDPGDITTELKKVGNSVQSYRETMDYPLYVHGDDENDKLVDATNLKGENGKRPNQQYPLYVSENDTEKPFVVQQGSQEVGYREGQHYPLYVSEDDKLYPHQERGNGKGPNQHYPLYVGETDQYYNQTDGYGVFHKRDLDFSHDASKMRIVYNLEKQHFPIYASTPNYPAPGHDISPDDPMYMGGRDGYGDFKHINLWGTGVFKQNQDGKFPLATDGQRISLTPFPGSVEIKPMNGKELGCWRCIPATCQKLIDANMLVVKKNKQGDYKIYQKQYAHYQFNKKTGQLEPFVRTTPIRTILQGEDFPTNLRSNKEIKEIYGKTAFTYAKPLDLVKNLLKVVSNEGETVLDIFAGSGTTGQAAYEIGRQFILMQLDEGGIPELIKQRLDLKVGKDNYQVEE